MAPTAGAALRTGEWPIRHVVIIMLENHSYDNLFGTFPQGEGIPAWYSAIHPSGDPEAPRMRPVPVASWQPSTWFLNPNYWLMRAAMNGGRMDLFAAVIGEASMTVFGRGHIPNLWHLAERFTLADRYFPSVAALSLPNRLFSIAAQCGDWLSNRLPPRPLTYPTIFDRLREAGLSWGYYQGGYRRWMYNLPTNPIMPGYDWAAFMPIYLFPSLHDDQTYWDTHVGNENDFLNLLRDGRIPAFCYITPHPWHTLHPVASLRVGDAWTGRLVKSIMASPCWPRTAVFITFDDSGGYFDHVPPPQPHPYGYGPRVPLIIVSPYARTRGIYSRTADHASLLAFAERILGLEPLTEWDAAANPLLDAFDFTRQPLPPPPDESC